MKKEETPDYEIIGKGNRTIVFIHYFGGDAGSWKWLAKRLYKKHTCILLNLPGFGGTPPLTEPSIFGYANYINTSIKVLKLKNYTLCGHSMGGKLALYAAKIMDGRKPKNVILIAPSPPTVENMSLAEKKRMLKHPDRDEASATVEGATVKKLNKKRFQYAVNSQLRINEAAWDWWIKTGMQNNIADRITGMDIPSHIVYSKNDPVITPEAIYEDVLPYMKNPSVTVLGNVGHLIPMEAPRKLARQIKRITKPKNLPVLDRI